MFICNLMIETIEPSKVEGHVINVKMPRDHKHDLVIKPIGQLLTPLDQVDFITENIIEIKGDLGRSALEEDSVENVHASQCNHIVVGNVEILGGRYKVVQLRGVRGGRGV